MNLYMTATSFAVVKTDLLNHYRHITCLAEVQKVLSEDLQTF